MFWISKIEVIKIDRKEQIINARKNVIRKAKTPLAMLPPPSYLATKNSMEPIVNKLKTNTSLILFKALTIK